MLIKQVAGKTYRTIPNCNLMLKAILLNLEPYRLITVLRHCNICHTKQTARICLCKSWHKKRLNMFRSLNTSPKSPSEIRESPQNSTGRLLSALYKYASLWELCSNATRENYLKEKRGGSQEPTPALIHTSFSDWDSLSRKINRCIDTACHNGDWQLNQSVMCELCPDAFTLAH